MDLSALPVEIFKKKTLMCELVERLPIPCKEIKPHRDPVAIDKRFQDTIGLISSHFTGNEPMNIFGRLHSNRYVTGMGTYETSDKKFMPALNLRGIGAGRTLSYLTPKQMKPQQQLPAGLPKEVLE